MGGAALVQWLPGFRLFQFPVRMLMLLALPLALLAGWTTQALLDEFGSAGRASELCRLVLRRVLVVAVVLGLGSGLEAMLRWRNEHAAQASGFAHNFLISVVGWIMSVPTAAWTYWVKLFLAAALASWLLNNRHSLGSVRWKWAW